MSSKIQQYRVIKALLLELPEHVSALQDRKSNLVFLEFLQRAEGILKDFGKRQAANISTARSCIVASQMVSNTKLSGRKEKSRCALMQVGTVQEALTESILPIESVIDEARPVIRQVIQLIATSGALQIANAEQLPSLPAKIWNLAAQHEQLAPLTIQVQVHLGRNDIHAVILTEIELEDFLTA